MKTLLYVLPLGGGGAGGCRGSSEIVKFDKNCIMIYFKNIFLLNDVKHFEFYLTCHSLQISNFVTLVTD